MGRSHLDRSGEDVVLDSDFVGRIVCRSLTIVAGVEMDGDVIAEQVVVEGTLRGIASGVRGRSSTVTIASGGVHVGEIHATRGMVAGMFDGVLHAVDVATVAGSSLLGYVVCDTFRPDPRTEMDVAVFSGPGKSLSKDILASALRLKGMSRKVRVGPEEIEPAAQASVDDLAETIAESLDRDLEEFYRDASDLPVATVVPAVTPSVETVLVEIAVEADPVQSPVVVSPAPVEAPAPEIAVGGPAPDPVSEAEPAEAVVARDVVPIPSVEAAPRVDAVRRPARPIPAPELAADHPVPSKPANRVMPSLTRHLPPRR